MKNREELENGYPSPKEKEEGITKEEYSFDELAKGVAEGTVARGKVLKSLFAGLLGGLLSLFALPARDAEARLPSTVWAVVDKDGTLLRGRGVDRIVKDPYGDMPSGYYTVYLQRQQLNSCACVATAAQNYYGINISTWQYAGAVDVYTYSGTSLYDAPFSLLMQC